MEPQQTSALPTDRNSDLAATVVRERSRLGNFIRRRVHDPTDAEDLLQDVLEELVEAYRLPEPIEQAGAWMFRVARNRIVDRFRRKKPEAFASAKDSDEESGDSLTLEDLLPSPDAGPEAAYARSILMEELDAAIDELPEDQREVFIAHEYDGVSFKEISAETGVSVNTLLSRKHHAVVYLRRRLQTIYDEFLNP